MIALYFSKIIQAVLGSDDAWIGLFQRQGTFVFLDGIAARNIGWTPSNPRREGDCVHVNWRDHPHNTADHVACDRTDIHALCEKALILSEAHSLC